MPNDNQDRELLGWVTRTVCKNFAFSEAEVDVQRKKLYGPGAHLAYVAVNMASDAFAFMVKRNDNQADTIKVEQQRADSLQKQLDKAAATIEAERNEITVLQTKLRDGCDCLGTHITSQARIAGLKKVLSNGEALMKYVLDTLSKEFEVNAPPFDTVRPGDEHPIQQAITLSVARYRTLQRSVESMSKAYNEMCHQRGKAMGDLRAQQVENGGLQADLGILKAKLATAEHALVQQKKANASLYVRGDNERDRATKLEDELKANGALLEAARSDLRCQDARLTRVMNDLAAVKTERDRWHLKLGDSQDTVAELKRVLSDRDSMIKAFQVERAAQQEELGRWRSQPSNIGLKDQALRLERHNQDLNDQLCDQRARIEELQKRVGALETSNAEYRKEQTAHLAQLKNQCDTISAMTNRMSDANRAVEYWQRKHNNTHAQAVGLQLQVAQRDKRIKELYEQNTKLVTDLGLENSTLCADVRAAREASAKLTAELKSSREAACVLVRQRDEAIADARVFRDKAVALQTQLSCSAKGGDEWDRRRSEDVINSMKEQIRELRENSEKLRREWNKDAEEMITTYSALKMSNDRRVAHNKKLLRLLKKIKAHHNALFNEVQRLRGFNSVIDYSNAEMRIPAHCGSLRRCPNVQQSPTGRTMSNPIVVSTPPSDNTRYGLLEEIARCMNEAKE
jgi:chromosome segregation ATPase